MPDFRVAFSASVTAVAAHENSHVLRGTKGVSRYPSELLCGGKARRYLSKPFEIGRRRNLRDACQRLTHHFYPQGWVVCRAIEISLAEGAVAAAQKSHNGNRMESFPKISDKLASL